MPTGCAGVKCIHAQLGVPTLNYTQHPLHAIILETTGYFKIMNNTIVVSQKTGEADIFVADFSPVHESKYKWEQ